MQTLMLVKYIPRFVDFDMIKPIVFLFVILNCQLVIAYSCPEGPTIAELFESSEIALIGKVEKKNFELYLSKDKYLLTIKSVKKGKVSSNQITVWTNRRARCGATLEVGKEFVVFLRVVDGEFWTDLNSAWVIDQHTSRYTKAYLDFDSSEHSPPFDPQSMAEPYEGR